MQRAGALHCFAMVLAGKHSVTKNIADREPGTLHVILHVPKENVLRCHIPYRSGAAGIQISVI